MDKHGTGSGIEGAGGEFGVRIARYLQGEMTAAELKAFDEELAGDTGKREQFVRACVVEAAIGEAFATEYNMFREALVAREPEGKKVEAAPAVVGEVTPVRRGWGGWKVAAAIGVLAVPGVVALMLTQGTERKVEVAVGRVTDSARAVWEAGPEGAGKVMAGRELRLTSGWAEVTYDGGAKVTVVGPARFVGEGPMAMGLLGGRLSAVVVGGGFAVKTPDAVVTDLGTEFGVGVNGGTEVAVFVGKVAAVAKGDAEGKHRRVMGEGETVSVAAEKIVDVEEARAAWPQWYPRRLALGVQALSVADLLSGGTGVMGRKSAALDVGTGQWAFGKKMVPGVTAGDGAYHRVPSLPVVDGCFVPRGRTVVDSGGHGFDFGETGNVSYNQLRVGGPIPWLREDPHKMSVVMGGVDYGAEGHTVVAMPGNKGVTIDLEALRLLHPGVKVGAFEAMVGNSFPKRVGGEVVEARADVYVLVDGEVRMERRGTTNQEKPVAVKVGLGEQDRFLTLVVTDGGDGVQGDWVMWGDARVTVGEGVAP